MIKNARLRHARARTRSRTCTWTRTPCTPTCRRPAPSAATGSRRRRGRTRADGRDRRPAGDRPARAAPRINLLRDGDRFHTGEDVGHVRFVELLDRAAAGDRLGVAGGHRCRRGQPRPREGVRVRAEGHGHAVHVDRHRAPQRRRQRQRASPARSRWARACRPRWRSSRPSGSASPSTRSRVSGVDTDGHPVRPADELQPIDALHGQRGARRVRARRRRPALPRRPPARAADADELELRSGHRAPSPRPERRRAFADVIRPRGRATSQRHGRFPTEGGLDRETGQGSPPSHWHQAAGAAEVEVDLETGKVEVLRYHAATYAGRVVNPAHGRRCRRTATWRSASGRRCSRR